MFEIANDSLRVDVLDPAADRARLGARYGWGGYIWQVHDRMAGPLFSGPEWPETAPLPFNGQGLPESFRHRTRDGRPLTWQDDRGVALGIGELAAMADDTVVVAPCAWHITPFGCGIRFRTHQQVADIDYQLERTLGLFDRELRSTSRLTNCSNTPLRLEWFAHPFFTLTNGRIRMELPSETTMAENPGFVLNAGVVAFKRTFVGKDDGHLDFLHLPAGQPLQCRINHPRLTHIDFATTFVPSECLVWGNGNTFSIEPYQVLDLAPRETRDWNLRYTFGRSTT